MKLKEKVKDKIDNNENITFIRKLWADKRYRSLLLLAAYFIFFFIVIAGLRSSYEEIDPVQEPVEPTVSIEDKVKESFNNLNNYDYEILLNDEEIIKGNVNSGVNTFTFNKKDYIIVSNMVYLKSNDDLKKVDLTKEKNLLIPIQNVELSKIYSYLESLKPVYDKKTDEVVYNNVLLSNVIQDEVGTFELKIIGTEKIKQIDIDLSEYAEYLKYDEYKLTIVVGDETSD